ncbi:MAG: DUF1844 domain-containing protein [Planctomycetes bacterium]|nr:DUF1844 domain-containing protein [Planctomycetota bacterium]
MSEEKKPLEKKILIDDDWKSQVAAEKEALKQEATTESPAGEPPMQMPPASFEMLVTTLATEAMVALGQFPNPATQEVSLSPDHASYAIDMLAMLEEKTKGNLSPAEEKMMTELLHQLRMMFVQVQQSPQPSV